MRNAVLVQAEGAQRTRSALILSGNGCGPRTLVWRGPRAPAASWAAAQLRNRPWGLLASPAQPSTYSWRSRDTGPKSWTILTLPAGRPSQESGARLCPKGALHPQSDRTTPAPPRRPTPTGCPECLLFPSRVTPTPPATCHSGRRTSGRRGSPGKGAMRARPRRLSVRAAGPSAQGLHHSAQTKVEGTVGRAPPHGGRVLAPKAPDVPSNPSRAPIRCRNSDALNAPTPPPPSRGAGPQAWDGDSSASGRRGGLEGTGGHFSQSGSPARPHKPSPKAPADRAKAMSTPGFSCHSDAQVDGRR